MKFNKEDVFHLDYTYESAYRLALEALRIGLDRTFCVCGERRNGGRNYCGGERKGVAVPKQLGVVGFDDTRVAQMIKPPLTTVHVPMSKMGTTAIELLCQRIAEPERPPAKVSLAAELVVRQILVGAVSKRSYAGAEFLRIQLRRWLRRKFCVSHF